MPGKAKTKEVKAPSDLGDQVFNSLVRLFWGARQHNQALQRSHGVTAAQLSALRVLERHGDLTHSELAGMLLLSGSTVSGMVDRLEKKGLIQRRRSSEDRRLVRVSLEEAGRSLLTNIPKGQSKFGKLRQLVRDLPAEEARSFLDTLNKLIELLSAEGVLQEGTAEGLIDEESDSSPTGEGL